MRQLPRRTLRCTSRSTFPPPRSTIYMLVDLPSHCPSRTPSINTPAVSRMRWCTDFELRLRLRWCANFGVPGGAQASTASRTARRPRHATATGPAAHLVSVSVRLLAPRSAGFVSGSAWAVTSTAAVATPRPAPRYPVSMSLSIRFGLGPGIEQTNKPSKTPSSISIFHSSLLRETCLHSRPPSRVFFWFRPCVSNCACCAATIECHDHGRCTDIGGGPHCAVLPLHFRCISRSLHCH